MSSYKNFWVDRRRDHLLNRVYLRLQSNWRGFLSSSLLSRVVVDLLENFSDLKEITDSDIDVSIQRTI